MIKPYFAKIVKGLKPLTIFVKKIPPEICSDGF